MSADPIKLHRITTTVRPFSADTAALAESGRAIMRADRVNESAERDLAEAEEALRKSRRLRALKVACAIGRPELADEFMTNFDKGWECDSGHILHDFIWGHL